MWLPNRIFKAFRQQCLQKIAWIESFLNEHAMLPPEEITHDVLDELNKRKEELSHIRQRMTSEWTRHLTEVQEWGLKHGQKEPSEELLQIIKETNRQVNHYIRLSDYFHQINTVSVKMITTAPQQNTPIQADQTANIRHPQNTPMAIFTTMTEECITLSKDIQESITDMRKRGQRIGKTTRNNAICHRDLLMVKL